MSKRKPSSIEEGYLKRPKPNEHGSDTKSEWKEEETKNEHEVRYMSVKSTLERIVLNEEVTNVINDYANATHAIGMYAQKLFALWTLVEADKAIDKKRPFPKISQTIMNRFYRLARNPKVIAKPYTPKSEATRTRKRKSKEHKVGVTVRTATRKDRAVSRKKSNEEKSESKEEKKKAGVRELKEEELEKRRREKKRVALGVASVDSVFNDHWKVISPPTIVTELYLAQQLSAHRRKSEFNMKQHIAVSTPTRTKQWLKFRMFIDNPLGVASMNAKARKQCESDAVKEALRYIINGAMDEDIKTTACSEWIKTVVDVALEVFSWSGIAKMDYKTLYSQWWLFIPWLQMIRINIFSHEHLQFYPKHKVMYKKRVRRKGRSAVKVDCEATLKLTKSEKKQRPPKGIFRSFSLVPEPKFRVAHIQINQTTLWELFSNMPSTTHAALMKYKKTSLKDLTPDQLWYSMFDQNKLPKSGKSSHFMYYIATDGYSASVLLSKQFIAGKLGGGLKELAFIDQDKQLKKALRDKEAQLLELEKKEKDQWGGLRSKCHSIDMKEKSVVAVDPGRSSLFTGVIQNDEEKISPHDIFDEISYKNDQMQRDSGSLLRRQKVNKLLHEQHLSDRLRNTPSSKNPFLWEYKRHLISIFRYFKAVMKFYSQPNIKRLAMISYAKRARMIHNICKTIAVNGKDTVVVFGDASFSSTSPGYAPTPGKKIRRHLARYCTVIPFDEYRTSRVCSRCCWRERDQKDPLRHNLVAPRHFVRTIYDRGKRTIRRISQREEEKEEQEKESKALAVENIVETYKVRICPKCKTHWNRDVNAARNVFFLFHTLVHNSRMPSAFIRQEVKKAQTQLTRSHC